MSGAFLCANSKLGFQALTNSNHLHYPSGIWNGWDAVPGNRPSLWKLARPGSESRRWPAEPGTIVQLWVVETLCNNTSRPHYPSATFQCLGLSGFSSAVSRRDTRYRDSPQYASGGGPCRTGWEPSWNCPCVSSAAQANGTGFPGIFLNTQSWDKGSLCNIIKASNPFPSNPAFFLAYEAWIIASKFMSVYHKILTES